MYQGQKVDKSNNEENNDHNDDDSDKQVNEQEKNDEDTTITDSSSIEKITQRIEMISMNNDMETFQKVGIALTILSFVIALAWGVIVN